MQTEGEMVSSRRFPAHSSAGCVGQQRGTQTSVSVPRSRSLGLRLRDSTLGLPWSRPPKPGLRDSALGLGPGPRSQASGTGG